MNRKSQLLSSQQTIIIKKTFFGWIWLCCLSGDDCLQFSEGFPMETRQLQWISGPLKIIFYILMQADKHTSIQQLIKIY